MKKGFSVFLRSALCILSCAAVYAAVPDGYVVKVDSATLYLDWGSSSGAHIGDAFTVYREGEALKHPVTGEVLGHAEATVGTGTLQTLEAKFSVGHLDQASGTPKAGDRVRWLATPLSVPARAATLPAG